MLQLCTLTCPFHSCITPSLHPCELGCVIQLILSIMTDHVSPGVTGNHSLDTVPGCQLLAAHHFQHSNPPIPLQNAQQDKHCGLRSLRLLAIPQQNDSQLTPWFGREGAPFRLGFPGADQF